MCASGELITTCVFDIRKTMFTILMPIECDHIVMTMSRETVHASILDGDHSLCLVFPPTTTNPTNRPLLPPTTAAVCVSQEIIPPARCASVTQCILQHATHPHTPIQLWRRCHHCNFNSFGFCCDLISPYILVHISSEYVTITVLCAT